MVSEIALVERTKRILLAAGGRAIKTHGSSMQQGAPDLLCCYRGWFVAIEMKVPGEKPRPLQFAELRKWEAAGAIAFWSDNPDEVMSRIEAAIQDRRV